MGTGKTRVAIRYYVLNEAPKRLIVITTAKKRDSLDWEDEASKQGIGETTSMPGLGNVTVDSWNNLWKYVDIDNAFFIFDEQRVVGSGKWAKTFIKIAKKNRWLLLSATPGDTWMDYIPVFVANGFYKNRTEFLDEHVVYSRFAKYPKVERYNGVHRLIRYRNDLLVDMPYERHTERHIKMVDVTYDKELFDKAVKDRWNPYLEAPQKDAAELVSVMRKVVNSDQSRLMAVRKLMEQHPRLIVFYNFNYELDMLRGLWTGPKVEEVPLKEKPSTASNKNITEKCNDYKNSEGMGCKCQTSCKNSSIASHPGSGSFGKQLRIFQPEHESMSKWAEEDMEELRPRSQVVLERLAQERAIRNSTSILYDSSKTPSIIKDSDTHSDSAYAETPLDLSADTHMENSSTKVHLTAKWNGSEASCSCNSTKTSTKSGKTIGEHPIQKKTCSNNTTNSGNFSVAEWNGQNHDAIPMTARWVYLVQYTAGAEGWNCVETDAVVFYSLNYSYRIFEQCQGRIDRLNTLFKDLYYYVLKSDSIIDNGIWKVVKVKKTFNEKGFLKSLEKSV